MSTRIGLRSRLPGWQALALHHRATGNRHVRDLFRTDPGRATRYSLEAAGLFLDYSKNRVDDDTMRLLLNLAGECDLPGAIAAMFNGARINATENRAVLHIALRNRSNRPIIVDGRDVMPDVNAVLDKMAGFARRIRTGEWRGHTGKPIHTMVNIGIGPSNAKTITDHIAVLRPHAWLMLGHCAGLRNTQKLGDYVLAHGYVRQDHVLDADLPVWVPVPALAEIQVALERAVGEITGLSGYALKSVMRTGTVATIDNRNWELRDHREPVQRFSQSRAIALDMESATIAANGFRFRVPYGTLLCVSDKPLHGELKLPGMADAFYKQQVGQHLKIGIRAMERLRELGLEQLHSRKLRSFAEVAFQ